MKLTEAVQFSPDIRSSQRRHCQLLTFHRSRSRPTGEATSVGENAASRFPTEAGHGRVGRIAGQGGSGWCGSKGGKGQTLSSTCCNLSTRTNTCQTNFCRGDKNFWARNAEHCHSYDWFSFVARTNRKNNNSKESFVFVINENILNNS